MAAGDTTPRSSTPPPASPLKRLSSPFLDTLSTKTGAVISRHARASKFRQMYLLPRYIVDEEDGSKRKLEYGEFHHNSKLYSIYTPIGEMSTFGTGVGMYFTTIAWVGIIMFCCGIIYLPNAIHFDTAAYDPNNRRDRSWKVGGSASCSTEERVCLNPACTVYAGEFHYPSIDLPRFAPQYKSTVINAKVTKTNYLDFSSSVGKLVGWRSQRYKFYDDDTTDSTAPSVKSLGYGIATAKASIVATKDKLTVGKRGCRLQGWLGVTDLVMMSFVSLFLLLLGRRQDAVAEALDLSEQTAQDYAVMIQGTIKSPPNVVNRMMIQC